jgi:hypothetical protein
VRARYWVAPLADMAQTLALEGSSGTSSVIDSLAYIDILTPADQKRAESLIDEEIELMRRSGTKAEKYIAHLQPVSSFLTFAVRLTTWLFCDWTMSQRT